MLNTLTERSNGKYIDKSWFNQLRRALLRDVAPRNPSAVITALSGALGSSSYLFTSAFANSFNIQNGLRTLSIGAASGVAADYNLTLPSALPASKRPVRVSSSGVVSCSRCATDDFKSGAVTNAKLSALNYATTYPTPYNLVASYLYGVHQDDAEINLPITTSGGPVLALIMPGMATPGGGDSWFNTYTRSRYPQSTATITLLRAGVPILSQTLSSLTLCGVPCSFIFLDILPAAYPGTHTYDIRLNSTPVSGSAWLMWFTLTLIELQR